MKLRHLGLALERSSALVWGLVSVIQSRQLAPALAHLLALLSVLQLDPALDWSLAGWLALYLEISSTQLVRPLECQLAGLSAMPLGPALDHLSAGSFPLASAMQTRPLGRE
jgi:hypothetical protein